MNKVKHRERNKVHSSLKNNKKVPNNETDCRIALIMPVYNEADTIEHTVRELYKKVVDKMGNIDIWVFEDGSTDGTKEVLEKLKDEFSGLHTQMTRQKKGYPRAMREAFLNISPKKYDYVVAVDSDGQYEPEDRKSVV